MAKQDLSDELTALYFPSPKAPALIKVPKMNFLMIDGQGNPNISTEYQQAIEALYGVCYTMKFTHAKGHAIRESRVMPLEGLWCIAFDQNMSPDAWQWTAMIMQPKAITRKAVEAAVGVLRRKKNPAALPKLRFEAFAEGLAVQIMYLGPYADEKPTIERLHRFAEENGYRLHGKHHEIYYGDPRRTKPERLKTVIRQPVERIRKRQSE